MPQFREESLGLCMGFYHRSFPKRPCSQLLLGFLPLQREETHWKPWCGNLRGSQRRAHDGQVTAQPRFVTVRRASTKDSGWDCPTAPEGTKSILNEIFRLLFKFGDSCDKTLKQMSLQSGKQGLFPPQTLVWDILCFSVFRLRVVRSCSK